jgi:hypothetical protein
MKKLICIAMLIGTHALADEHQLDGRTYAIQFKKNGGGSSEKDTLQFRNGRFRSLECDPYGFSDAGYRGDAQRFSVETGSSTEGRIAWEGTIRGADVKGTFVWTRPGKAPEAYTFEGSAVAATPPKGFDANAAREHLLKHQKYPATKAQILESCNHLMCFSDADRRWFAEALPEGTYHSAAEVMKVVILK